MACCQFDSTERDCATDREKNMSMVCWKVFHCYFVAAMEEKNQIQSKHRQRPAFLKRIGDDTLIGVLHVMPKPYLWLSTTLLDPARGGLTVSALSK